jgi:hypothetical protein
MLCSKINKTVEKKQKIKKNSQKLYSYSPQKIRLAIEATENGSESSVLSASKRYGIPRSTLHNKLQTGTLTVSFNLSKISVSYNKSLVHSILYSVDINVQLFQVGPDTVLGFKIEEDIVAWLIRIICRGAPIPVEGLKFSVRHICKRKRLKTPFNKN